MDCAEVHDAGSYGVADAVASDRGDDSAVWKAHCLREEIKVCGTRGRDGFLGRVPGRVLTGLIEYSLHVVRYYFLLYYSY